MRLEWIKVTSDGSSTWQILLTQKSLAGEAG